jgi:hypothetical protein
MMTGTMLGAEGVVALASLEKAESPAELFARTR